MMEYTLVMLGGDGVGKSALATQFIENRFRHEYEPTIEDTYRKQVNIDSEACILVILDTAGQHELRLFTEQTIIVGDGFLLVFAVNNPKSLTDIKMYFDEIKRVKGDDFSAVMVANKCDLQYTADSLMEAREIASQFGCKFVETSAKTNNPELAFRTLVQELRKKKKKIQKRKTTFGCAKNGECSIL